MLKQATMAERLGIAKKAARDIEQWLKTNRRTTEVLNVEDDPIYQVIDVDLLWRAKDQEVKIEIKGDTYHKTGNFFLETYSNEERNTPGCFMYTQADFVFYYFVEIKTLYSLPMPETKDWFEKHINEFKESRTQTPYGNGQRYTTVGRLVPIKTLMKNVPGIKLYKL
jgi:hypothetical protein